MPGMKPKYLKPEDISPEWREYYDCDRQKNLGKSRGGVGVWTTCPDCGKERWTRAGHVRSGGRKTPRCRLCANRGPLSPAWKRGYWKNGGYNMLTVSGLPHNEQALARPMANAKGCVPQHRLVMARHLGRPLKRGKEIVHHVNGIRDDNRIENLKLLTKNTHHSGTGDNYYQRLQEALAEIESLKAIIAESETQS